MLRSRLALLMILFAAPAYAGSRSGGGFQSGGFHGGGFHSGGFHGGFRGGGGFHGGGLSAFHRSSGRAHGFFGGYGYGYGYDCGFGDNCGVYNGNGYGGINPGNSYGGVYGGNGYDGSGGYSSDPVGAEIPPLIIPTNCWVRRAAYDPSGAYMGQALINLCRPSDDVTVTGLKARAKTPETGTGIGTGQASPLPSTGRVRPNHPHKARDLSAFGMQAPAFRSRGFEFGEEFAQYGCAGPTLEATGLQRLVEARIDPSRIAVVDPVTILGAAGPQDEAPARASKATKTPSGARCEKSRWRRTVKTAAAMMTAPSARPRLRLTGSAIRTALIISSPPVKKFHQRG